MLQKNPHLFCQGPLIFFGTIAQDEDDEEIPEWELLAKIQQELPPTGLFLYWPETIE